MFTGIVAGTGVIAAVTPQAGVLRLEIGDAKLPWADLALGDSIAVNGVCLTAVAFVPDGFVVDVSEETLRCTTGLNQQGARVNLEVALRAGDFLGGHMVSGHVDGVGHVLRRTVLDECVQFWFSVPAALSKFLAAKGSMTVQGVSLTINEVQASSFSVNLIPHTLEKTNLSQLQVGDAVNLEVDLIARYLDRLLAARMEGQA